METIKKMDLKRFILYGLVLLFCSGSFAQDNIDVSIKDYGRLRKRKDAAAVIQKAIDDVAEKGGGRVRVRRETTSSPPSFSGAM